MHYEAGTIEEYIAQIPLDRVESFVKLFNIIRENLPKGFEEQISYSMPGFVVPHSLFPEGYHCNPAQALPFVSVASQKNFIALYHSGIYACPDLYNWFLNEYPKHCKYKLDMGKSCIRFKKPEHIPFELIGELMQKITAQEFIDIYLKNLEIYKKK